MDEQRYSRHLCLPEIGKIGQQKLRNTKILVIGVGGLGCPLLQYLTAAGVGFLGIVDHDRIEKSNLIRQVLFDTDDIGRLKVEVAEEKLKKLNPDVQFKSYPAQLTSKNALSWFEKYDLIIDGTDNFSTRYLVNDACVLTNKPFVSGSLYKFEGQLSVFNYQNGPTYRCVYPKAPNDELDFSCSEHGVLGVLPGIMGNMMANEVIKLILGIGEIASEKILVYDALNGKLQSIAIQKNPKGITKIKKLRNHFDQLDYHRYPDFEEEPSAFISKEAARNMIQRKSALYIDFNSAFPAAGSKSPSRNYLKISFVELPEKIKRLAKDRIIIINSESKVKNKTAFRTLKKKGFKQVYILEEETTIS